MAAGFDKNAEVPGELLSMGFGHAELGTVTPRPQDGNPKPRVFRYPAQQALINRMGFPSAGMNTFKANLSKFLGRKTHPSGVVGINIGMNKNQIEPEEDYRTLIKMLGPMADYLSVNISSPNTPGLRNLQEPEALTSLLAALDTERRKSCGKHPPPLLVKFAPDLDDHQLENIAKVIMQSAVDGVILTNTTLERPDALPEEAKAQAGGLSGKPVGDKSTAIISKFYTLTGGKVPIIGVGGVSSGRDAYDKIRAGASLVQLYTGLIYEGPAIAHSINRELLDLLKADGLTNITEAVGRDVALEDAQETQKKVAHGQ
jgi:dihydroorotate dehydrogenase